MAIEVKRVHRFTAEQYLRMVETGILTEDDRVELLDGEIVEMTPIGAPHAAGVDRVNEAFLAYPRQEVYYRIQGPIQVGSDSVPQPDFAVLRRRADFYREALPGAGDVLLVVEVADTAGLHDRRLKTPLYARGGIVEAWLVDLAAGRIEVYREPCPAGYRQQAVSGPGEWLTPLALPGCRVSGSDILGRQG
jgi:hypothetical protein